MSDDDNDVGSHDRETIETTAFGGRNLSAILRATADYLDALKQQGAVIQVFALTYEPPYPGIDYDDPESADEHTIRVFFARLRDIPDGKKERYIPGQG